MSIQQVKENLEKLNQRNQSLIDLANATTGKEDTTLTDGVNSLIEKYDLEPTLQEKVATENGEVAPDEGYDGLSKVTVNVPDREVKLQDKTITENGTYSADSGYDGLGSVTVDVASGMKDGFTVNFHDTNNDLIATSMAKFGCYVGEPPNHIYDGWKDSSGNVFENLPYTSDETVIVDLYAYESLKYAKQLYEAYGVDETQYPYFLVMFMYQNQTAGNNIRIIFGSSYTNDSNISAKLVGYGANYIKTSDIGESFTSETINNRDLTVDYLVRNKDKIKSNMSDNLSFSQSTSYYYLCSNFDLSDKTCMGHSRLDV